MEVTPAVRSALLRRGPEDELEAIAVGQGMRTLPADGYRKAAAGITSVEEVVRALAL
jgi:type II secretory ATPase GspE/PulE/Tfp pilus assembly ATPase PilB-like protein